MTLPRFVLAPRPHGRAPDFAHDERTWRLQRLPMLCLARLPLTRDPARLIRPLESSWCFLVVCA